jgi:hypothetical protein
MGRTQGRFLQAEVVDKIEKFRAANADQVSIITAGT